MRYCHSFGMGGQQCPDEVNSGHFQHVEQLGESINGDSLASDTYLPSANDIGDVDDLLDYVRHCDPNFYVGNEYLRSDFLGLILANATESTDDVATQSSSAGESSLDLGNENLRVDYLERLLASTTESTDNVVTQSSSLEESSQSSSENYRDDYFKAFLANTTESTDNVVTQSSSSEDSSQSSSQNLDSPDIIHKKKPLSPYMLYSKENFHKVKSAVYPCNASEVGRKLGSMWNKLPPEEKQNYVDRAKELKEQSGRTVAIEKPCGVKKKTQKRPRGKQSLQKIVGSISLTEQSNGSFQDAIDSQSEFSYETRPLSAGRPTSVESRCSTDSSRSPMCPSYVIPQNRHMPQQHQGYHQILESQRPHPAQSFQVGQSFPVVGQRAEGNYMQQPLYQQHLPQRFAHQYDQSMNANHLKLMQAMNPHSFRPRAQTVDHYRSNQQTSCANSNFYPVNSVPNVMMMNQGLDTHNLMNILRAQDEEIKNLKSRLRSALATNYNLLNVMGSHGLLGSIQNGHQS